MYNFHFGGFSIWGRLKNSNFKFEKFKHSFSWQDDPKSKKFSTTKLYNFLRSTTFILIVSPSEVVWKIQILNLRNSNVVGVDGLAISMSTSLIECIPRLWGWSRLSLHPWLDTIFSINILVSATLSEKNAPPAAASKWLLSNGTNL